MLTQMTERDKKLLIFLFMFVVITVIGYWGIYPNIKAIQDIKDKKIDAEMLQEDNQQKLMNLPMLETEKKKLKEQMDEKKQKYFPKMQSDDVDRYFTNLALQYNLKVYDMQIALSEKEILLKPYKYSKKYAKEKAEKLEKQAMEEETDESSSSDTATDGTSVDTTSDNYVAVTDESLDDEDITEVDENGNPIEITLPGIYSATVTLKLGGSQKDIDRIVENLSSPSKKLRIKSYSNGVTQNLKQNANGSYTIHESELLTMVVDIYMCEG